MSFRPDLSQYKDVDFGFDKNSLTNDIKVRQELSSISQSIKNIALTSRGERPFSEFGFGMYDYLREIDNFATQVEIRNKLSSMINRYEPRVTVDYNDIEIIKKTTDSIEINMTYKLVNDLSDNFRQTLTIAIDGG
jgi:phage baseplate assembly protein W